MPKEQPEPARRKRVSSERRRKTNQKTNQNMQTAPKRKRRQKGVSSKEEEKLSNTYSVNGSCSGAAKTSQNQKIITVTPAQRAKWQRLPKSKREHLESVMHWSIVSLLYETTQHYSETEKHLNLLKKRLQTCLKTLRVPVEKLGSLNNVHKLLAEERKRSINIEEGLKHLQKEKRKMLQAAEVRKQNIEQLQEGVQNLKRELAAEETAAKELFEKSGDELGLPDISKYCQKAPILQEEVLKIGNQESLLNYLQTFQQSEEVKAMSAFIEKAHDFIEQRN